jgi:hypothetical protein
MKRLIAVCAGTGIAFGSIAAYSTQARASWVRASSEHCFNSFFSSGIQEGDYGVENLPSDQYSTDVDCPVPDDDRVPKSAWKTCNIELYQNNAGAASYAGACYASWNGQSGACSPNVTASTNAGHQTIQLSAYIGGNSGNCASGGNNCWNTNGGTDFGHLFVRLQPGARLAGVYYSN